MKIKDVTELVFENIENLLLEGRVENIKKRYPQPVWDEIDKLVKADPSKTNKYLEWTTKQYLPKTIKWFKDNIGDGYYSWELEDIPDSPTDDRWGNADYNIRRQFDTIQDVNILTITDNLEHFHKNPSKYEIKDINQYSSKKAFEDAVESAKQKLSRKEQKEVGIDKVFEDDNFLLLMPKTHKAACRYGSNTRWCVTMRGYSGYFENYFGQGPIFFLIDKRMTPRSYSPQYMQHAEDYWKVAIHYRPFNGRLDQSGNRALNFAKDMDKQEFINGGMINNTLIDYWNVQDIRKVEGTVSKYLGGPGRGQRERAQEIFNNLKGIMQNYTMKALGKYYDSLGDDSETLEKLEQLKTEREELRNKKNIIYYKKIRLEQVQSNLMAFTDRLSEDNSDNEYLEWAEEQHTTSSNFLEIMYNEENEFIDKIDELGEKIDVIGDELSDKKLVFYDKEKNTPMEN